MGFQASGDHQFPTKKKKKNGGMWSDEGIFPLIYDFLFMKICNNYDTLRYNCTVLTLYERIKENKVVLSQKSEA